MNENVAPSRNEGPGWGAPIPPSAGQWNPGPPPTANRWDHDRVPLDNGASSWDNREAKGQNMTPGNGPPNASSVWRDMPTPNIPGGHNMRHVPPRLPPGKDPWGQPHGRPWGNDTSDMPPIGGHGIGWGDAEPMKRDPGGWAESQWGMKPRNPAVPVRGSPGWDEGPMMDSGMPGGWGSGGMKPVLGGPKKTVSQEAIWNSKPYRMLCDMGVSKNDAENALRSTNLNLEDALEILNQHSRLPVGNRNDQHPFLGGAPLGGGEMSGLYGKPGGRMAGFGNQYSPQQEAHGMHGVHGAAGQSNISGNNLAPNMANLRLMQVGGGMGGGAHGSGLGPVRPTTVGVGGANQQPSSQQLKLLVQQIQMAVQGGHLNQTILNQPLAPQTLILLNQLLQQIKSLQTQQQTLQTLQKSMGPGANNSAVLSLSIEISKTKNEIGALQAQINQQQTSYLSSQKPQQHAQISGVPPQGVTLDRFGADPFNQATSIGSASLGLVPDPTSSFEGGGSRLNRWIMHPQAGVGNSSNTAGSANKEAFSKAPGAIGKSGSNLPFSEESLWQNPGTTADSTWPDTKSGVSNNNTNSSNTSTVSSSGVVNNSSGGQQQASNGVIDFSIPEFEPGKPWKGPGIKNPDEDPNLTPGSLNMAPIELNTLTKASAVNLSSQPSTASSANAVENSLGLNSTWSFGQHAKNDPTVKSDTWSSTSSSASNMISGLTPIGEGLWGKPTPVGRPPGLGAGIGVSGSWSNSNGWISGAQNGGEGNNSSLSCWVLLKNLNTQVDISTIKTLCVQHGPLKAFHPYLNQGIALVLYTSYREAQKVS